MKANELIIGKWYKFFPYENEGDSDVNEAWHMKYSGDINCPIAFIEEASGNYEIKGQFKNYSEFPRAYISSAPEEINPFLPENEKIFQSPIIY